MQIDKKVATLILRAQNASDGGKGIDEFVSNRRSYRDNCAGYAQKDRMILSAIELIRRNRSNFKYAVVRDRDGIADYIVYFETRINGKKYQVSFHSFSEKLSPYVRGFRARWDHGDSPESAYFVYRFYNHNGEYGGDFM